MQKWVLLDTETDGLYSPIHIIEVSAQRFIEKEPDGEPFRVFINHDITIPPVATAIHGYTTSCIKENGIDPEHAYTQLRNYIGDSSVSSHYLRFDWDRVLIPELQRLQIAPIGTRGFCSWCLSRRTLPEHPTHRLDYLRDYYKLRCSRPHSALGDVESVTDLLQRIIFPQLSQIGLNSVEEMAHFSTMHPLACRCLIQGLSFEDELKKQKNLRKERRAFEEFLMKVECDPNFMPMPQLIMDYELIEESPKISFEGNIFLFTGGLAWGLRSEAEAEILKRRGVLAKSKSITRDLDYLVLGEDKIKGWTSLLEGGKLREAFLRKLRGTATKFKIIREEDFIAALQDLPAGCAENQGN